MSNLSPNTLQSIKQFSLVWQHYVRDRGSGDVRDLPGLTIRWADSEYVFWNCLVLPEVGLERRSLEQRLAQAADYMRSKRQPGLLWIFEDLLDPAARIALPVLANEAGLDPVMPAVGMAGDLPSLSEPTQHDLSFVRVRTEDELMTFADLNSHAYGMPLQLGRAGFRGSKLWKEKMHAYIGLANGTPVATAATIETDGCLYVAFVATAPEAQRRGYGEVITRKAIYEGARASGLNRVVLHASMVGVPVYARIGLKAVATISTYHLKA